MGEFERESGVNMLGGPSLFLMKRQEQQESGVPSQNSSRAWKATAPSRHRAERRHAGKSERNCVFADISATGRGSTSFAFVRNGGNNFRCA